MRVLQLQDLGAELDIRKPARPELQVPARVRPARDALALHARLEVADLRDDIR